MCGWAVARRMSKKFVALYCYHRSQYDVRGQAWYRMQRLGGTGTEPTSFAPAAVQSPRQMGRRLPRSHSSSACSGGSSSSRGATAAAMAAAQCWLRQSPWGWRSGLGPTCRCDPALLLALRHCFATALHPTLHTLRFRLLLQPCSAALLCSPALLAPDPNLWQRSCSAPASPWGTSRLSLIGSVFFNVLTRQLLDVLHACPGTAGCRVRQAHRAAQLPHARIPPAGDVRCGRPDTRHAVWVQGGWARQGI